LYNVKKERQKVFFYNVKKERQKVLTFLSSYSFTRWVQSCCFLVLQLLLLQIENRIMVLKVLMDILD